MKRNNSTDGKTTSKNSSTTLLHHPIQSSWPKLPLLPRPLSRFYPTNGRRDIGCNPKTEEKRAPGICGITAELLKSGGAPVISWLLPLFTLIWKYCVIPTEWNLALFSNSGKENAQNQTAPNTEASLLSVPAKVFAHICLARMQRTIFAKQRP